MTPDIADATRFDALLRRALGRRAFLRGAAGTGAGGAALVALGCGSSSAPKPTASPAAMGTVAPAGTAAAGGLNPVLLTQEFVAGQSNRFSIGLLDAAGKLVKDAAVHLRFYEVGADGKTGTFRGEGAATFVELNVAGAHTHDSSPQGAVTDNSVAFYVARTPFDVAGKWGVEISVTPAGAGAPSKVQVPFDVLAKSQSPGLGAVPPASRNDTVATNTNAASLCSRTPACPLHDKVIGDVLGKGRPLVVQFSTPAFCQTRFCGPVLEVLLAQAPQYQDRVDFVHIEVWQDHQLQQYRPAVKEWNLPGEPYTFFMGKDGTVVGRLEAIFSDEELAAALKQLATL